MNLLRIASPEYLLRPKQIAVRLAREVFPGRRGVVETVLPWGLAIRIDTDEAIGRSIWHGGLFDLAVSECLWRLLRAGDTAVDAGANIGYMTSIMAHRVGPAGKVLSFEAHPAVYRDLQHNLSLFAQHNSTGPVQAYHVALSDCAGEAHLVMDERFAFNRGTAQVARGEPASHSATITVEKRPLDSYLSGQEIAVMKLDVEDHEMEVLQGAADALANRRIRNIVYENFGDAQSPVHATLRECGFHLFALGWKLRGPVLSRIEDGCEIDAAYDAPSYLATLDPAEVHRTFRKSGWHVI